MEKVQLRVRNRANKTNGILLYCALFIFIFLTYVNTTNLTAFDSVVVCLSFEWLEEDIAACACGVTNEADCAGDCRSGVGNGGFNNQNLNGAKPGVGEDKVFFCVWWLFVFLLLNHKLFNQLGYCGECGAAITIVGRRVELKGRQSNTEGTDDINCVSQTSSMRSSNESISYIPSILIGAISLIPSDAEHGIFRSETMELLRTLRPTIMRWPGGNFVSGYNWVKCVCYKGGVSLYIQEKRKLYFRHDLLWFLCY